MQKPLGLRPKKAACNFQLSHGAAIKTAGVCKRNETIGSMLRYCACKVLKMLWSRAAVAENRS